MSDTIKINAEFDLDALNAAIANSGDLNNNEAVFGALSQVARVKKQLADLLDQVNGIESAAKSTINSKATALYGEEWTAIKGTGYKITRSRTGDVYTISGKPNKKFLKVKESVDAKLVDAYVLTNEKLPAGIDRNPSRGYSLRMAVDTAEAE